MQPIEVREIVSGEPKSVVMPPLGGTTRGEVPTQISGPDIIVGDLPDVEQLDPSVGTQVGLGIATTSCNNGTQPVDWFALPNSDHPVVPQNLYRMSGGTDNTERFEQVGQSLLKHTFYALEDDDCALGCNTNGCDTGTHLCPGCSDPYTAGLNGDQYQIGSRAWVNPFTGNFPPGDPPGGSNDHTGHIHDGVSHRVLVEVDDLNTTLNQGATYFAEAQYVAPSEYTWCQAHSTIRPQRGWRRHFGPNTHQAPRLTGFSANNRHIRQHTRRRVRCHAQIGDALGRDVEHRGLRKIDRIERRRHTQPAIWQ